MAVKLSRRVISRYVADQLLNENTEILDQLAAFLVDEHRTHETELIVRSIESALAESGIVIGDVVSARPLSEDVKKAVNSYIASSTSATSVAMREHVDATELGGIKISLPDSDYDATLRGRLAKLQEIKV